MDEEQVFKQAAQSAEEIDGFFLAVGAGAIAFCRVEELRIVGVAEGGAQQDQSILAAGEVKTEVDRESSADRAFGKASGESAVRDLSSGRRVASRDSRSAAGSAPRR